MHQSLSFNDYELWPLLFQLYPITAPGLLWSTSQIRKHCVLPINISYVFLEDKGFKNITTINLPVFLVD